MVKLSHIGGQDGHGAPEGVKPAVAQRPVCFAQHLLSPGSPAAGSPSLSHILLRDK